MSSLNSLLVAWMPWLAVLVPVASTLLLVFLMRAFSSASSLHTKVYGRLVTMDRAAHSVAVRAIEVGSAPTPVCEDRRVLAHRRNAADRRDRS